MKKPGDYFATQIGRQPVVMVRDENGELRVIHNQCAHRGAMVVATEKGNAAEFTCCYHGWTYHLDGRLKARAAQPRLSARTSRPTTRRWRCSR